MLKIYFTLIWKQVSKLVRIIVNISLLRCSKSTYFYYRKNGLKIEQNLKEKLPVVCEKAKKQHGTNVHLCSIIIS